MRYMIIVKATPGSEAGVMPSVALMAAMAAFHEELARAGVLLDASGLKPSSTGWRVSFDGTQRSLIDGPFAVARDLVAGYTLIQVRSRDEALEWSRRFPNPATEGGAGEIEVRPLLELDDFEPTAAVERFRTLEAGRA